MVGLLNVSDYGKILGNQGRVASLQQQMQTLQDQVASGKKAQTFGGYGTDASVSLSFRAQNTRLDSYNTSINRVLTRANIMDTAMTDASSIVSNFVADMKGITQSTDTTNAAATTRSVQAVMQSAQDALAQVTARMNTRVDGRYAFSGDQVNSSPVPTTATLTTNTNTIVDGLTSGTSAATILASLNGMNSSDLGLNADLATAGNVTVRADDNIDVDYTVKADSDFFKDIMRGLGAASQMEFDPAHADEFWKVFNGISNMLDTAGRKLDNKTGELGQKREQLTNLQTQNSDLQLLLETNIASIEDVDPAVALTNLNNMQTQLQATYQLIAQAKDLSLINYL